MLVDVDGDPIFAIRPDAVLEAETLNPDVVFDTKWKKLKPNRKNLGVEHGDVYQMIAYARAWGVTRLILLYPWRKETANKDGILRRWTVTRSNSASDVATVALDIATVDVGAPDRVVATLRDIVDSPGP